MPWRGTLATASYTTRVIWRSGRPVVRAGSVPILTGHTPETPWPCVGASTSLAQSSRSGWQPVRRKGTLDWPRRTSSPPSMALADFRRSSTAGSPGIHRRELFRSLACSAPGGFAIGAEKFGYPITDEMHCLLCRALSLLDWRIVLQELFNGLSKVLLLLFGLCLRIEGFASGAAPHQILFGRFVHINNQRANVDC